MKKSRKIALTVATSLLVVGLVLLLGAMAAMDFDFTGLNTVSLQTSTYQIDDDFHHIALDEAGCDVRFYPSEDHTCKVVCRDNELITYCVSVADDTLHINQQDCRKWYQQINLYWGKSGTTEISIYLPESSYQSLNATLKSGDIAVPEGFCFESVNIRSSSGDITLEDVDVSNLQLTATSGDLNLFHVQAQTISANTTSGEIEFTDVLADESVRVESTSGDVSLQRCDAETLHIQTTSGDVSGTLLTDKVYLTDTTSGDVNVPQATSGGVCKIQTTSGDIDFH